MGDMPRPSFPNLYKQTSRHGTTAWYVRLTGASGRIKIRIRADYGTPEFKAQYLAAMAGEVRGPDRAPGGGTFAWLLDRYREASSWTDLSLATRRQRENIFRQVLKTAAAEPAAAINAKSIAAGVDRRKDTPNQARHFLDAMRGLFAWAAKAQLVKADPTAGLTAPAKPDTGGHQPWTEEELQTYEMKWPLGTRERVWLDVLLYTGARRGDAVAIGRPHVKRGVATFRTEKSGRKIEVSIRILPPLQASLDAGPTGDLTWIIGAKGRPLTKEAFGNEFRKAARAAGVWGKSAHGLRKVAAERCAYNGATVPEMNALFGWTGFKMAMHYIERASRRRLAEGAAEKMLGTPAEQ